MKISDLRADTALDSRGNPTVRATVFLADGSTGTALVPSGASTGAHEAKELRDGDEKAYRGQGVGQAVKNVEEVIRPALAGFDCTDQSGLDRRLIELDGTEDKSRLGANAILAVSLANSRAAANALRQPLYRYLKGLDAGGGEGYVLPIPMMNVLNGGKHADWATDIQEYMIMPVGAATMSEAVRQGAEVYHSLKQTLKARGYNINVGDEGGYAPAVATNEEPFVLLQEAIEAAGYALGRDFILAIDAAATEFYKEGAYVMNKEGKSFTAPELAAFYSRLASRYPIRSWEDVFAEDDWGSFRDFSAAHPDFQVVGDDLYVTNVRRLERGIAEKTTNSILIKLNQIGTLSETIQAVQLARRHGLTAVISHRSGETEDHFIADLAVALGTGQIKTGAPARSERTAKYNRLLAIEKELGVAGRYASWPFGQA